MFLDFFNLFLILIIITEACEILNDDFLTRASIIYIYVTAEVRNREQNSLVLQIKYFVKLDLRDIFVICVIYACRFKFIV
jgi:hypothetical protein